MLFSLAVCETTAMSRDEWLEVEEEGVACGGNKCVPPLTLAVLLTS